MPKYKIKKISLKNLLISLGERSSYKKNQYIDSLSSFDTLGKNNLGFLEFEKLKNIDMTNIKASCVIIPKKINLNKNYIINKNPRYLFEKICKKKIKNYLADKFIEGKELKNINCGKNVFISKYAKIDSGVKIGNNVTIHKNSVIKKNSTISSGVVIGNNGVGPYLVNGRYNNCTHLGGVYIGKDCYIGTNTVITRGTLADTVIGNNCIISNLINIGHNVKIGDKTLISSSVSIGGSSHIGKNVQIGIGTTINKNIFVGNNCKIGIGTNVVKSLNKNEEVFGNPAKKIKFIKKMF